MLDELIGLAAMFRAVVTDEQTEVRRWRRVYLAYVQLDAVVDRAVIVVDHYLPVPFDAPFLQNSSLGPPVVKWVTVTNEDFEGLDQAVRSFLDAFWDLERVL